MREWTYPLWNDGQTDYVYKVTPQRDLQLTFVPPNNKVYDKAPLYFVLPGGGINFMVDAGKVVDHGFTWVPTPATVAPVEYTMTRADYEAIGGHMDQIKPVAQLREELGE